MKTLKKWITNSFVLIIACPKDGVHHKSAVTDLVQLEYKVDTELVQTYKLLLSWYRVSTIWVQKGYSYFFA